MNISYVELVESGRIGGGIVREEEEDAKTHFFGEVLRDLRISRGEIISPLEDTTYA